MTHCGPFQHHPLCDNLSKLRVLSNKFHSIFKKAFAAQVHVKTFIDQRGVTLKRFSFLITCSKVEQVCVVMVACSSGGSVRVSCLAQNVDGAGSEPENHPAQSQGVVLGCCSRPGNSEDEEDGSEVAQE